MNEPQKKYKTHTSNEVKKRYIDKTYVSYSVKFRQDEDADVINAIEELKKNGIRVSDAFKILIRKSTENIDI